MRRLLMGLLASTVVVIVSVSACAQTPDTEQLSEAARRDDAAAVKVLLENGADVNAKFRYGATALAYACDRGYIAVVKVLLEHGAAPNVKDTFYGATPLYWALSPAAVPEPTENHIRIVKMLLEKGAEGKEHVLITGARIGNIALVKMVLEIGGVTAETLSTALAGAVRNKHEDIAQLLRGAGAVAPRAASFQVDAETLARYAGSYRSDVGEAVFTVRDDKLFVAPSGQPPIPLGAIDKFTFQPEGIEDVSVKFQVEGDKVTGFILKQGTNETQFKKVGTQQP